VKTYKLVGLMLISAGVGFGQVEIGGLYENVLNVQYIDDWSILDLNNLVFSVDEALGGSSFLHADAEASLPFGALYINVLDYIPDSLTDMYGWASSPWHGVPATCGTLPRSLPPSFSMTQAIAGMARML
jgi:hypothetical protein